MDMEKGIADMSKDTSGRRGSEELSARQQTFYDAYVRDANAYSQQEWGMRFGVTDRTIRAWLADERGAQYMQNLRAEKKSIDLSTLETLSAQQLTMVIKEASKVLAQQADPNDLVGWVRAKLAEITDVQDRAMVITEIKQICFEYRSPEDEMESQTYCRELMEFGKWFSKLVSTNTITPPHKWKFLQRLIEHGQILRVLNGPKLELVDGEVREVESDNEFLKGCHIYGVNGFDHKGPLLPK